MNPIEPKKWYLSKTVWLMVLLTCIGAIPLVGDFIKGFVVNAEVIEHASTMLIGLVALVIRIWFTQAPITG